VRFFGWTVSLGDQKFDRLVENKDAAAVHSKGRDPSNNNSKRRPSVTQEDEPPAKRTQHGSTEKSTVVSKKKETHSATLVRDLH
jgi:hypothetical protein